MAPLLCCYFAPPVWLVVEAWDAVSLQVQTWSAADLELVQCIVFASLQILSEWSCDAHSAAPHHGSSREGRAKRYELGLTVTRTKSEPERESNRGLNRASFHYPTFSRGDGESHDNLGHCTSLRRASICWARIPVASIYDGRMLSRGPERRCG